MVVAKMMMQASTVRPTLALARLMQVPETTEVPMKTQVPARLMRVTVKTLVLLRLMRAFARR